VTAPVHDRMPVILEPDAYDLWLDPGMQNVAAVSDLLKPYDRAMRCYPISARINSVANDDAECSALWTPADSGPAVLVDVSYSVVMERSTDILKAELEAIAHWDVD